MSKRENFYRRDPSKALSGMIGLSLEERGVYNTILDLLYSTWRPIEDDRRFIANWCGCAVQKLNPILNRLIASGRLIAFEEAGRTYVSDEAFEAERKAVKGAAMSRSGRREVGEKSGEVQEKSAGVGQNPPLLEHETTEKQSVTALEKSREEKKDANASSVAAATSKPKGRVYPEAFEAAWQAYPHHKGRSSKPNAAAEFAKLPPGERAGLVAAIGRFAPNVGETCGGKGAPDMAVWLKAGKHLNWQAADDTAGDRAAIFNAPQVRASIVKATDEDFARSYVDPYCRWVGAGRRLEAKSPAVVAILSGRLGAWATRNDVTITLMSANDTPPLFAEEDAA